MKNIFKKIYAFLSDGILEEWMGRFAIVLVIVPVIINIINRTFFQKYSVDLESIALFAYVWIGYGFFGYLYSKDAHVDVKFIVNMLPPAGRYIFELFRDLFIFVFSGYMTYWGVKLCIGNIHRTIAGSQLSYVFAYSSIAFGFFSGFLHSAAALLRRFFKGQKKEEKTV